MAKNATQYACQSCGASYSKWVGKCEACNGWNTIVVESAATPSPYLPKRTKGRVIEFVSLKSESENTPRRLSHISEFDRVCGGGLVPGSAILIGGDPGIGKSTLLLQITAQLARTGARCLYISGEESLDQIRLRAHRLKQEEAPVQLAAATSLTDILATLDQKGSGDVVVIDSIQTTYAEMVDSAPGTVTQVRTCASELIRLAKKQNFTLFLVGHVTKEGMIAGPRVLEHMVDTVLYFEGDRGHQCRILRAVKNRYGATDEIGVFEMTNLGLAEVTNPSSLFLTQRRGDIPGACVFAGLEGSRPILVEIQALVAPSSFPTPRRATVGWDSNRLSMLIAVLESRCGVSLAGKDVYLNVVSGLRVTEPAADLAVATALLSSLTGKPIPQTHVVFGEIGLSGEIRPVSQTDNRLKEAAKLGFTRAILPPLSAKNKTVQSLSTNELESVLDLARYFQSKPQKPD